MTRAELLQFLRRCRYAVQASVAASGAPQAAVVGIAVTERGELVFDTLGSTRKIANLRRDPRIALVAGWDDDQTVQLEGLADEPQGEELARVKRAYFAAWPDGVEREQWPGITYVRVRPQWVRYSDFRAGGGVVDVAPGVSLEEFRRQHADADELLERRWSPGQVVDAHSHPFDAQAVVTEGEMWLTRGGETQQLVAGDTFHVPAAAVHAERYGEAGATYWVARRKG